MAKFSFNGMDAIEASFQEMSQLSDEEKYSVIAPAAELLRQRFVEKIKSIFVQRSGKLAESITVVQKSDDAGTYAHITPTGKHPASSTGKRKRKDGKANGRYSGSNAEVAWILEHGSPRITPRHWMETTNEESEDEVIAAEEAAWDDLLRAKGL